MSTPKPRSSSLLALLALLALLVVGTAGCSTPKAEKIRTSLDQAGLKDVSVTRDRDNGIVTLGGHVPTRGDKSQAESIARAIAGAEVVSNQIAVITTGSGGDQSIASNLDAALIQNRLHESVHYDVIDSVVTLTGEVESQDERRRAETIAAGVPNVLQVVNQVKVRGQKIWRIDRN
jgi:osmotically-inducible protein OsmY